MTLTKDDIRAYRNHAIPLWAINEILKYREKAEKWDKLDKENRMVSFAMDCNDNMVLSPALQEKVRKNEKIVKELEHRKKHPQAFNYAQFEVWVTDILNGGDGFPLPILGEEK